MSRFDDLDDQVRDILVEEGFLPVDMIDDFGDDYDDLGWMLRYRFDAFAVLPDNDVALVRWSEDGIDLVISTRNYVIGAEAHITMSADGVAIFASAIKGLPS